MKRTVPLLLISSFICLIALPQQAPIKNPFVEKIVKEISARNIKATIEKLVSFGTRHTLSDTLSETRGIGAARRWIKSELERYAKESNGRMAVEFHETIVPPSARVPSPTKVVNVVATMKPDHSSPSADRIIVVSGHYDSRAGSAIEG